MSLQPWVNIATFLMDVHNYDVPKKAGRGIFIMD
jgi:hypothetical protein